MALRQDAKSRLGDDVIRLWDFMTGKYDVKVYDKRTSGLMSLAGKILQRLSIMSYEQFMNGYVTTIGNRIYIPFKLGDDEGRWSYWDQIVLCAHEFQHVRQFNGSVVSFVWNYVRNPEKRALYECQAFRGNFEMEYFKWKELPYTSTMVKNKLRYYGCSEKILNNATHYIDSCIPTIELGGVVNQASKDVINWLRANAGYWELKK